MCKYFISANGNSPGNPEQIFIRRIVPPTGQYLSIRGYKVRVICISILYRRPNSTFPSFGKFSTRRTAHCLYLLFSSFRIISFLYIYTYIYTYIRVISILCWRDRFTGKRETGVKFLAYLCNLEIIGGVVAFPCITFPLYFKISFKNSIKILSLFSFFFSFFSLLHQRYYSR